MTKRRFYFQVPSRNIINCIEAYTFTDAKALAFNDYAHCWQDLQWLTKDEPTNEAATCTRVFF